jgi:hypothetical protein
LSGAVFATFRGDLGSPEGITATTCLGEASRGDDDFGHTGGVEIGTRFAGGVTAGVTTLGIARDLSHTCEDEGEFVVEAGAVPAKDGGVRFPEAFAPAFHRAAGGVTAASDGGGNTAGVGAAVAGTLGADVSVVAIFVADAAAGVLYEGAGAISTDADGAGVVRVDTVVVGFAAVTGGTAVLTEILVVAGARCAARSEHAGIGRGTVPVGGAAAWYDIATVTAGVADATVDVAAVAIVAALVTDAATGVVGGGGAGVCGDVAYLLSAGIAITTVNVFVATARLPSHTALTVERTLGFCASLCIIRDTTTGVGDVGKGGEVQIGGAAIGGLSRGPELAVEDGVCVETRGAPTAGQAIVEIRIDEFE